MRNLKLASALAIVVVSTGALGCSKKDGAGDPASESKVASPLGGSFEGVISVHVAGKKAEGGPVDFDCALKKDSLRIEVPKSVLAKDEKLGTRAWAVFRASDKKGFFAMETSKVAYTVDFDAAGDELKKAVPHAGPPGMAPSKAAVKRTGKKDTVAGIPCDEWEVAEGNDRALVCMAEESASWLKVPTKALPDDLALTAELLDGKHFPLRVVAFEKGAESGRIEVTKIEKKSIPDADVQVPATYQQIDVMTFLKSGMGDLMGAGGAPPRGAPPGVAPIKPKPKK
jgi:hypothetical protein